MVYLLQLVNAIIVVNTSKFIPKSILFKHQCCSLLGIRRNLVNIFSLPKSDTYVLKCKVSKGSRKGFHILSSTFLFFFFLKKC